MDLRLMFNEDVKNYDKYRPLYVKELYQDIIRYSGIGNMMSQNLSFTPLTYCKIQYIVNTIFIACNYIKKEDLYGF